MKIVQDTLVVTSAVLVTAAAVLGLAVAASLSSWDLL